MMRRNGVQIWMVASLCLALVVGVGGCASSGDTSGGSGASTSSSESGSATAATRVIPASSPLARVKKGMTDSDVERLVGKGDGVRSYPSFFAFLPWVNDGWRVAWLYPNVGRVVFSQNRWSGSLSVVDIQHNPNETQ